MTNEKMIKKIIWAKNATQWGMGKPDKNRGNPPQKTLKNKGLLVFKNIPVSYTCHFYLGKW